MPGMKVEGFDHIAMPTADVERLIGFYKRLGFEIVGEERWRGGEAPFVAIRVDEHVKVNVHAPELWQNERFTLRGPAALPGSADLCFYYAGTIEECQAELAAAGVEVIVGPVSRQGGADGGQREGTSVYARDPDGNLLEWMTYSAPR
jgi:catechol 2,3-dioxygenase-like lactoylglutathione lyase family enzyme